MTTSVSELPKLPPPAHPSFAEALKYWLRLGFISFGGPAGQIALMHQELVERRRWISEARFLHALNYCMVLPGPEAQQLATYIGWLLHGIRGGVAAGLLFILPSFFILVGLSWVYMAWGHVPAVSGALWGVKPAVVAIVLAAAHRIGKRALKGWLLWSIAASSFVASFVLEVPFPAIVACAALLGVVGGRLRPNLFKGGAGHGAGKHDAGGALVLEPPVGRPGRVLLVSGLIGAGSVALLLTWQGTEGLYTQLAWLFSKAALVTFGGAYAVLPYVYDQAVQQHGWLTPLQMMDGLALGETTPGPLIMVVTYVGFVAGWNMQALGVGQSVLAAWLGAAVATLFTFLPSFVFILVGAPWVERTRDQLRFSAPLTAITAAVVGVVLNMGMFFAWHVFMPKGVEAGPSWAALAIGVGALLALIRFELDVMRLLAVTAGGGLLLGVMGWLPS